MNDIGNDRRKQGDDGPDRDDDAFVARAATLFDESVGGLDAATRSRLNRGRQRALDAVAAPRPALVGRAWLPTAAAAAVAVVTVSVVMWSGEELPGVSPDGLPLSPTDPAVAAASDFEILLDQDGLELLEDLEFYSWLDLDEAGNGGDGDENVG